MPKSFAQKCNDLMRELLDLQDKSHILDLSNNTEFFRRLQEDGDRWSVLQYLDAKGYISISQNPVSHKLLQIHISKLGVAYPEDVSARAHEKRVEWIRYIITTAIAVAALIRSFLPEITAAMERLGLIS